MNQCKGEILDGWGISFEEKAHVLNYIGNGIYECIIEGCNKKFTITEQTKSDS